MLESLGTPRKRILTLVFLAICCVFAATAAVVGIDDNPPGILLAYAATVALVLALVHPWRTTRKFRLLLFASVLGLALFAILHIAFEGVATKAADGSALRSLLEGLGGTAFLLAVLVGPPALLIGAIGWIALSIRNRRGLAEGRNRVA